MDDVIVFNHGWQLFRERPAMFLTPVSICALWHFVRGYELGRAGSNMPSPFGLPADFHEWVAYRLHFHGANSGWANMIVERAGDGPHALERFFALLDEHQTRVPRVAAELHGCQKTYTEYYGGQVNKRLFPPKITLTAYTDDPGLFVSAEGHEHFPGKGFCPNVEWFELTFGPSRSRLTIFDQAAVDRWSAPDPDDETQMEDA
jgi:hypothetical protein